jgi:hypothetical protein
MCKKRLQPTVKSNILVALRHSQGACKELAPEYQQTGRK